MVFLEIKNIISQVKISLDDDNTLDSEDERI